MPTVPPVSPSRSLCWRRTPRKPSTAPRRTRPRARGRRRRPPRRCRPESPTSWTPTTGCCCATQSLSCRAAAPPWSWRWRSSTSTWRPRRRWASSPRLSCACCAATGARPPRPRPGAGSPRFPAPAPRPRAPDTLCPSPPIPRPDPSPALPALVPSPHRSSPPSYSAHLPSPDLLPQPRGPGTSDPSSPQRGAVRGAPERGHHVHQAPGEQVTKACPRGPRSVSCGARGTGERQDGGNALAVQSVGRRDPKCRWRSRAWIPRAAEGGKPDEERPG